MITAIFWMSLALVAWCYAGYPAVMRLRARGAPEHPRGPLVDPPNISVVLALRDEVERVDGRIHNLLELDYPVDRLEVVAVCNGCSDGTEPAVRRWAHRQDRVRCLVSPKSEGKAGALNRGVNEASGELILFADARQRFERDVARRLAGHFSNPDVGAVSGRLVVARPSSDPSLEGITRYWRFETALRLAESRTGSCVAATGAIYMIRRDLFEPLPPGLILDDLFLPMSIAAQGRRVLLDPEARAHDRLRADQKTEWRRRVRTMAGNFQLLALRAEWLLPNRTPVALRYLSHKVLRLAVPMLLTTSVAAGLLLFPNPLYQSLTGGLLLAFLAGVAGLTLRVPGLGLPASFLLTQTAIVVGLLHLISDPSGQSLWDTERSAVGTAPSIPEE